MKIRTATQVLEQQRRDHEPNGFAHRARAAAAAYPPGQPKGTIMKKSQVFKSDFLRADDVANGDLTLTITSVEFETFKYNGGKAQEKAVLHFKETDKKLPLNSTNWDRVVSVTSEDDTDGWPGKCITLYQDNYWDEDEQQSKPCIRVSTIKPTGAAAAKKKPLRDDLDDEIPPEYR
jgi:hypothetical protein